MFEYLGFWIMKKISELMLLFILLAIIGLISLVWIIFIVIKDKFFNKNKKRKDKK